MKVLVATKERKVFDHLGQAGSPIEVTAALDTRRIYQAIPTTQLAIIDYHDLISQPFSEQFARKLLERVPFQVCSSSEFLASPDTYLRESAPMRPYVLPDKRTIVFTSYSGGTGKTSLALDTALHFAAQTKAHLALPTAVIEFTYAQSALQALLGGGQPMLYDLVSQPEMDPGSFLGVTLYPMDYGPVQALSLDQVQRYCHEQISHHVLTVIDTIWPHGLVPAVSGDVDLWVVVTTPRIDAVENARRLHHDLAMEHGDEKVIIAVNQMGGLGATLALWGTNRDLSIPRVPQAGISQFNGRLGKEVLGYVYGSLWQDYERANVRSWNPFRKKERGTSFKQRGSEAS